MREPPVEWSDTIATFAEITPATFASALDGQRSLDDGVADEWIGRCRDRILELDPDVTDEHATVLARFMSSRPAWREQTPEDAAGRLYKPPYVPEARRAP